MTPDKIMINFNLFYMKLLIYKTTKYSDYLLLQSSFLYFLLKVSYICFLLLFSVNFINSTMKKSGCKRSQWFIDDQDIFIDSQLIKLTMSKATQTRVSIAC